MTKVLFFNVPTQGHVNPTYPVVSELVRRGVEVVYYLTEGYRAKIEAAGAEFRPYPSVVRDDYFESRNLDGSNPPSSALNLLQTSKEILPELIEITRREQPDVILHDSMCPWGWMVAEHLHIPHVSSLALLLFDPLDMLMTLEGFGLMLHTLRNVGSLQKASRLRSEINRTYNINAPSFPDVLLTRGTITLSYTSAMFQPKAEKFGKEIKYVGPAIEHRADSGDFPFDQLDGRPLIYISLGTVINQNLEFYRESIKAFKDAPYQVVMSVGKRTDIGLLGEIPGNFIIKNFVPQLEILQRASLFISHAGMNSVHEGLYYDVPLVLAPQQSEQNYVAGRVEQLGAGIKLKQKPVLAEHLRTAADRVLNAPSFKEKARQIGASFREAGGQRRAVDEILALVNEKQKA